LRAISKSQDEAHHDQTDVEVFQDHVCNMDPLEVKSGILHGVRQDNEGDVEVSLGKSFVGHGRREFRGVWLTSANQEKMRLKTW